MQLEIFGCLIVLISALGMGRDRILYFWSYDAAAHGPLWNGPLFRTLPEVIYLGLGLLIAVFVTAQYASSRPCWCVLAPPGRGAAFEACSLRSATGDGLGALCCCRRWRPRVFQQPGGRLRARSSAC